MPAEPKKVEAIWWEGDDLCIITDDKKGIALEGAYFTSMSQTSTQTGGPIDPSASGAFIDSGLSEGPNHATKE